MREMNYVVLLGTGPWQRDLFDILSHLEFPLCCVSPDPVGFENAYHIRRDVRDVDAIEADIYSLGIIPKIFVSSQTDLTVSSAAILNHRFRIKCVNLLAAEVFTNKILMRNRLNCITSNLLNPRYFEMKRNDHSKIETNPFSGPNRGLVIKPVSLQSSLGVRYIERLENFDFKAYFNDMKSYRVEKFILEEMVLGEEFTIEGYKNKSGEHVIHAASLKEKKFGFGIANSLHYSPEAYSICNQLSDALNSLFSIYDFGPTHTEVIRTVDEKFYLVEAAIRGGGSGIPSNIVPILTGFHPEWQMISDALSIDLVPPVVEKRSYVSLVFYEFRGKSAVYLDTTEVQEAVVRNWCNYKSGARVEKIVDDRSRHGFVILAAESKSEINKIVSILAYNNPMVQFNV